MPSNGAAEPRHSISSASCAAQQHGLLSVAVVFCSSVTPSARASSPSPRPEWVWSLHGEARILDAVVPWTRGWAASWTTARCVGAAGGAGVFEPRAGAAAWDARRCDAERRVGLAVRAGGAAVDELQRHNIRFSSTGGATPGDPTEQKFDQLT